MGCSVAPSGMAGAHVLGTNDKHALPLPLLPHGLCNRVLGAVLVIPHLRSRLGVQVARLVPMGTHPALRSSCSLRLVSVAILLVAMRSASERVHAAVFGTYTGIVLYYAIRFNLRIG